MTDNNVPNTAAERVTWLKDPENRNPIRRQGAGSIYYRGDVSNVDSIEVIVSTRANAVGPGIAHFGGLSEEDDFKNDGDLKAGIRNALREGQEEMEELLGYEPDLKEDKYVFLYAAHDDKFFIENGHGFAVDARLHAYEAETELWDALFPNGATETLRDENHTGEQETEKAEVFKFKDILRRQDDYHYAHEYFALWVMAAKVMKADIAELIEDVNAGMDDGAVDFKKLADRMYLTVEELEDYLGDDYEGVLQTYEASRAADISAPKKKSNGPRF